MASSSEIGLGRVLVNRGLLSQEQILSTLRQRNEDPDGPDLGTLLVQQGLLTSESLQSLQKAVEEGEGQLEVQRDMMQTDHCISLTDTREAVARECLQDALAKLEADPTTALHELRRLASEFCDTESGVRASERLREHETGRQG